MMIGPGRELAACNLSRAELSYLVVVQQRFEWDKLDMGVG